ncbi:Gfo/Idh/MocA family protein [Jeotgalibaca sp. A127]|uniref:Gfo/Idh/MocA family protein n=1 Tax=Jeotgalibaca sp. A127 TaxID=3457324 RepID=UPI003FD0A379
MNEVVWGMIGCGDVTEKKTGPGLYKAKGSRLKGVFSRTQARAEDWVNRHGHGTAYLTVEEMLADAEITAVYIATPPDSHYAYAMQAIAAGKAVLMEKPMAIHEYECQEIITAAEKAGVSVFVNFYRRGLPKIQMIKEKLDQGEIGKPLTVEIRHFQKPHPSDYENPLPWRLRPEAGGGKALDTQVHVMDYLSYFFGHLTWMDGCAMNKGGLYTVEDTTVANFIFSQEIIGTAAWCYVAGYELDEVTITGTAGKMVFSGTGVTDLVVNGEAIDLEEPEHVGLAFIQSVVDELNGKGNSPADLESAALVTRWFERLLSKT